MARVLNDAVEVRLLVLVIVDPKDPELLETVAADEASSITDVVAAEVVSNLESVSYVKGVSVTRE